MYLVCALTGRALTAGMPVTLLPLLRDARAPSFRPCLLPLHGTVGARSGSVVLDPDPHAQFVAARWNLGTVDALADALAAEEVPEALTARARRLDLECGLPAALGVFGVAWVHRAAWALLASSEIPGEAAAPSVETASALDAALLTGLGFVRRPARAAPDVARAAVGAARFTRRFVHPQDPDVELWADRAGVVRVTRAGRRVGPTRRTLRGLRGLLEQIGAPLDAATLDLVRAQPPEALDLVRAARVYRRAVAARRRERAELRADAQGAWTLVRSTLPAALRATLRREVEIRVATRLGTPPPPPLPRPRRLPPYVMQTFESLGGELRVTLWATVRADGSFGAVCRWRIERTREALATRSDLAGEPELPFPPALWGALAARGYRPPRLNLLALDTPWFCQFERGLPYVYGRRLYLDFAARTVALTVFLRNLPRAARVLEPSRDFAGTPNAELAWALARVVDGEPPNS